MVTITKTHSKFIVGFKYNVNLLDRIRQVPGRKFIPSDKTWTVPISQEAALKEALQGFEYVEQVEQITPEAILKNPKVLAQENRIELEKGHYCIYFNYDPNLVALIRKVPGRKWDKGEKRWTAPVSSMKELELFLKEASDIGFKFQTPKDLEKQAQELVQKINADLDRRKRNIDKYLNKFDWKVKPYKHQIDGLREALARKKFGIFDEQGLGKTLEAIVYMDVLLKIGAAEKVLIVCPNSVKYNWYKEIAMHTSLVEDKKVAIYDRGASIKTQNKYQGVVYKDLSDIKAPIIIMNYEGVFKNHKRLKKFTRNSAKSVLILDESQRIKNPIAKVTRALLGGGRGEDKLEGIGENLAYKLIMSGTPIANKPEDSWTQLRLIDAPISESYSKFLETFTVRGQWGPIGYKNTELLRNIIGSCSLRRLKSECLDLPEKIYQVINVQLSGQQLRLYNQIKEELAAEILTDGKYEKMQAEIIIVKMLRLAQIASNPALITDDYDYRDSAKFRELDQILKDIIYDGQKAVVWTTFRENVTAIVEMFPDYNPVYIMGGVNPAERQAIVDRFQTDPDCKLFVATSAAREGITLTAANYAIYMDRDFNLVTWTQSQDRIHRIGQDKTCVIIKLVAEDSIDELIEEKLNEKLDMAQYLQGDKDVLTRVRISREDIERILG